MKVSAASISKLRSINWDFEGARSESEFSALHWHPCRFVSQIPAGLIGLLSDPGDVVLDPFSGSGTTLVEAQRLGRKAIGVELNPVAALVASAKTIHKRSAAVVKILDSLSDEARKQLSPDLLRSRVKGAVRFPAGVQVEKWYMPRVAADLASLWALLESQQGDSKKVGLLAFSSILLRVCRETRHWGYVCDNTTPNSFREADVLAEYLKSIDALRRAYIARERFKDAANGTASRFQPVKLISGDSRIEVPKIRSRVDLVVTSPPYFGVSDYAKSQRLTAEWLGSDVESARLMEIGARSKRHRRAAYDNYVSELLSVMEACRDRLVPGGYCCLVVGESAKRRSYINELHLGMENIGFEVIHIVERAVSEQRRQNPSILSEQIGIYRKR